MIVRDYVRKCLFLKIHTDLVLRKQAHLRVNEKNISNLFSDGSGKKYMYVYIYKMIQQMSKM